MSDRRFDPPARIVVKVGSSTLRAADGGLNRELVASLVDQIAEVRRSGAQVVLVSSGAVAAGLAPLGLQRRPADLPGQQAAASVGQGVLIHEYQARFAGHGLASGQVLLTPSDVVDRVRYLNARHTFDRLLELGAVPVVNENDTVATDELRFGDNDRLAALVASMLNAQLLILLSDVEGLYPQRPQRGMARQTPVSVVEDFGALDPATVGPSSTDVGRGGMSSKIEAAKIATFSGASAVIAHAERAGVIGEVVAGAHIGTWFPPSRRRPESRKLWIAFAPLPQGRLHIDAGAVRALVERGSSLLAAGIVDAEGDFGPGDSVDVVGPDNREVARGLTTYGIADVRKILGRSMGALQQEHGDAYSREVIHRDSLVVVA